MPANHTFMRLNLSGLKDTYSSGHFGCFSQKIRYNSFKSIIFVLKKLKK